MLPLSAQLLSICRRCALLSHNWVCLTLTVERQHQLRCCVVAMVAVLLACWSGVEGWASVVRYTFDADNIELVKQLQPRPPQLAPGKSTEQGSDDGGSASASVGFAGLFTRNSDSDSDSDGDSDSDSDSDAAVLGAAEADESGRNVLSMLSPEGSSYGSSSSSSSSGSTEANAEDLARGTAVSAPASSTSSISADQRALERWVRSGTTWFEVLVKRGDPTDLKALTAFFSVRELD